MKKLLTIALTLVLCCLGVVTFAGCERQPEYVITITKYPTECGKFVASMLTEDGVKGEYATPNDYKEKIFETIEISVKNLKDNTVWKTTGLQAFRNKGGSIEGANVSNVGTHTVEIKFGHDVVKFELKVVKGGEQKAKISEGSKSSNGESDEQVQTNCTCTTPVDANKDETCDTCKKTIAK